MNGFRVGFETKPKPAPKPRVSIIVLGGFERTDWCNWPLVGTLIAATKDLRFTVHVETVLGMRGFDSARNLAVDIARKNNSDFSVMFDNDVFSPIPPLDIVTDM